MEHNEIVYTAYHSRDWAHLTEQGYVTMAVSTHPVTGDKRAKMIRQRNENGQITTFTPRQAYNV